MESNPLLSAGDSPGQRSRSARFFLNARNAFPYNSATARTSDWDWKSSKDAVAAFEALSELERAKVLRFYKRSDASLSLGSHLLKHLAIVESTGVSWSESKISQQRDIRNGKPYFEKGGVDFNVSHHGEIVAVAFTNVPETRIGIDVVSINLEKDRAAVSTEKGFHRWIQIYADMFSPQELWAMANKVEDNGIVNQEELLWMRLRLFYANWACKEAYIKMTSDGLGASYLHQLNFTNFSPPGVSDHLHEHEWALGEITQVGVILHGQLIEDVKMEVQALGRDYLIATAFSSTDQLPPLDEISLRRDILPLAFVQQDSAYGI